MDSGGTKHPIHSFLLLLKFPIFRRLPEQKIRSITLADASSELVELLVDIAYGSDRFELFFIMPPLTEHAQEVCSWSRPLEAVF